MATSRTAMITTGSHNAIAVATGAKSAPGTTTLSPGGSRKAPERVVPCFRASQPSMPSDAASRPPRTNVVQLAPHSTIRAMTTGVANSRSTVIALAGVSIAEGPNVVAWDAVPPGPGTGAGAPGEMAPSLIGPLPTLPQQALASRPPRRPVGRPEDRARRLRAPGTPPRTGRG